MTNLLWCLAAIVLWTGVKRGARAMLKTVVFMLVAWTGTDIGFHIVIDTVNVMNGHWEMLP